MALSRLAGRMLPSFTASCPPLQSLEQLSMLDTCITDTTKSSVNLCTKSPYSTQVVILSMMA